MLNIDMWGREQGDRMGEVSLSSSGHPWEGEGEAAFQNWKNSARGDEGRTSQFFRGEVAVSLQCHSSLGSCSQYTWREGRAPVSIIGAVISTLLNSHGCLPLQLFSFWLCPERLFHVFLSAWRGQKEPPVPDGDLCFLWSWRVQKYTNTKDITFPSTCFVLTSGLWTNKQELLVTCMLVSCVLQLFSSALLSVQMEKTVSMCQVGWWSCQNSLSGPTQCLPINRTVNPDMSNHKCIKEGCGWRPESGKCSDKWWNLSRVEVEQSYLRAL